MNINREEIAWAAGFFDGEGSTLLSKKYQVSLSIGQSGDEAPPILERMNHALGALGTVRGPYVRGTHKPAYVLSIVGFERTQAVIAMMWPWLTQPKRDQASSRLLAHSQRVWAGRRDGTLCIRGHKLTATYRDNRGTLVCCWCRREDHKRDNDRNRKRPYKPRPSRRIEGASQDG
jgi:hypothetical protein